jgi:hypothetical protein
MRIGSHRRSASWPNFVLKSEAAPTIWKSLPREFYRGRAALLAHAPPRSELLPPQACPPTTDLLTVKLTTVPF